MCVMHLCTFVKKEIKIMRIMPHLTPSTLSDTQSQNFKMQMTQFFKKAPRDQNN